VIPTGTASGTGADIGQLIAGIAMMALAAFAPFVLLRFVPVVEAALLAQGISHMPARVAQQGMQASYYGQGLSRLAGSGGAAAAGGAAGGAPSGGGPPPGGGTDGPSAAGPTSGPRGGGSAGGGGAGVPSGEQGRRSSNDGSSNDGATTGPSLVVAHDRGAADRSPSGPAAPARRTGPATASAGNGSTVEAGPLLTRSAASGKSAVPSWPSRTVQLATPRPARPRPSVARNLTHDQSSVSG
jgi:hypothetical protein